LSERSAISLRDAIAPDVAEDRRPVHLERLRQLRHRDTPTVGHDQFGHFLGSEAPLDGESGNQRVGRVDSGLAAALP
jgi:hypothetical protein